MLFSLFHGSTAACGISGKAICKLIIDNQSSCRVKIKDIAVLLAEVLAIVLEQARVLSTECSLHIQSGGFHIAQHQNSSPFRDCYTCGQLANRDGDGPVILSNGFCHTLERFFRCFFIVKRAVSGSQNNLILAEHWMLLEFLCKLLC